MKAIFIPEGESFSIEIVSETTEEREALIKYWDFDKGSITCEEWREMHAEKAGQ